MAFTTGSTYYDAEQQKNLERDKISRAFLIWEQVRIISQIISQDPSDGGNIRKQILGGRGEVSIWQEMYVPNPLKAYYYSVMHLYALLKPDVKESVRFKKNYNKWHVKYSTVDKFEYSRNFALFKILIILADEKYGQQVGKDDIV